MRVSPGSLLWPCQCRQLTPAGLTLASLVYVQTGQAALHQAAAERSAELVKTLLAADGMDVNLRDQVAFIFASGHSEHLFQHGVARQKLSCGCAKLFFCQHAVGEGA